ncbi:MAG: TRAP transporter fused permease subunit [Marinovum algicola]|uniref:TRAP transporter permease n=1 Tax=Roseobacteraceae TaxID=2854170 RepID=UPI0032EBDE03
MSATDAYESIADLRNRVFPPDQRQPGGVAGIAISVVSVLFCLMTLGMAFQVVITPIQVSMLHLAIAIPMTFMLYPALFRPEGSESRLPTPADFLFAALALAAFAWALWSYQRFQSRMPFVGEIKTADLIFGVIAIVTVFEATRRTVGMAIVYINIVFIIYALTGPYWPSLFSHRGSSFVDIIENLYMLPSGMFNFIMNIMATFIFTFLTLGAFLRVSGGDQTFNDLSMAIAGGRRGGPAKVAVVSSSLMGMLSGSTISNVVTTGTMTIPLMIRSGFKRHEAAAIEATASLGGALTPPLMGAGVFIMAEFVGLPVSTILIYSVLPAMLYYVALYAYVDIKARKRDMSGLPRDSLPKLGLVLRLGGHVFIPILALIYLMLAGYTPYFASSACVLLTVLVSFIRRRTALTPSKLAVALETASRIVLTVSALGASAALIYGVISLTGLLVKVTGIILMLTGGSLFLGIVYVALMSYVLGMGLPVTAAYVLIAALGAPALSELGLSMFAAHLIIFWFSMDSTITPPICMTAIVAARIAGAPPMKTGFQSVLLAKALYVIPFAFAYGDLLSSNPVEIAFDVGALFVLFAGLPIAIEGYWTRALTVIERLILAGGCCLAFVAVMGSWSAGLPWLLAALAIASGVLFLSRMRRAAGTQAP